MVASNRSGRPTIAQASLRGALVCIFYVVLASAGVVHAGGNDPGVPTLAVLDLAADHVSRSTADAVSDSLRAQLRSTGHFDIPDRDAVLAASGSEICSESPCALTIGRELRAGSVAFGSVVRFGRLITISVTILDLYSGEVIDDLKVESLEGESGIPVALAHLVDLIGARQKRMRMGEAPYPQDIQRERIEQTGSYETSLACGIGVGVRGRDSNITRCRASGVTTVCQDLAGDLKWLFDVSMLTRMRHSRWVFGLRGGLLSVDTDRRNEYQGPSIDIVTENDSSNGFFLGPQLGLVVQRSTRSRVLAYACAGYRDFDDDSGVSRTFATAGLSLRLYRAYANTAYWSALGSDSLFDGLITASLGFVMGF